MTDAGDRELREFLVAAGRRVADQAPSFDRLRARAHEDAGRRRRRRVRVAALAAASLVAMTLGLGLRSVERREARFESAFASARAMGAWEAPLDFLLETPGRDVLRGAPRLPSADPSLFTVPEEQTLR